MPVNPALAVSIPAGAPFYRITAVSFHTANTAHHKMVVNGMGARKSHAGARYNYGGALTVYLADSVPTCFAEKMFYFQREVVRRLDALHLPLSPGVPAFSGAFTLWEIHLKKAVPDVCHLTQASASAVGVFPSLMLNPSQDYEHLKERRAFLESNGYQGIRAPSSRSTAGGEIIVLFDDQSKNVELEPSSRGVARLHGGRGTIFRGRAAWGGGVCTLDPSAIQSLICICCRGRSGSSPLNQGRTKGYIVVNSHIATSMRNCAPRASASRRHRRSISRCLGR